MAGISSSQGLHQVAQKLSSTTRPRSDASETLRAVERGQREVGRGMALADRRGRPLAPEHDPRGAGREQQRERDGAGPVQPAAFFFRGLFGAALFFAGFFAASSRPSSRASSSRAPSSPGPSSRASAPASCPARPDPPARRSRAARRRRRGCATSARACSRRGASCSARPARRRACSPRRGSRITDAACRRACRSPRLPSVIIRSATRFSSLARASVVSISSWSSSDVTRLRSSALRCALGRASFLYASMPQLVLRSPAAHCAHCRRRFRPCASSIPLARASAARAPCGTGSRRAASRARAPSTGAPP